MVYVQRRLALCFSVPAPWQLINDPDSHSSHRLFAARRASALRPTVRSIFFLHDECVFIYFGQLVAAKQTQHSIFSACVWRRLLVETKQLQSLTGYVWPRPSLLFLLCLRLCPVWNHHHHHYFISYTIHDLYKKQKNNKSTELKSFFYRKKKWKKCLVNDLIKKRLFIFICMFP